MSYVWWAIRNVSIDAVIARVVETQGYFRSPRWRTPLDLSDLQCACFALGDWTFVLTRGSEPSLDETVARISNGEVIRLIRSEEDEWAMISGSRRAEEQWSVYGGVEDDFLRTTGAIPAEVSYLLGAETGLDTIAHEMGRLLTGLGVDNLDEPAPTTDRIVELVTEQVDVELAPSTSLPHVTTSPRPTPKGSDVVIVDVSVKGDTKSIRGNYFLLNTLANERERLLVATPDNDIFAVDTTVFPPTFTGIIHSTPAAAVTPWQSVLVAVEDVDANSLVREVDGAHPQWISLSFSNVASLRGVAAGVIVFPSTFADGDAVPHLITAGNDGHRNVTRLALPRVDENADNPALASFADGSFIFTWQRATYRWHEGVIDEVEPLGLEENVDGAAIAADGSIIAASDLMLLQLWPDGRREHIREFGEVHRVIRGAGDAMIIVDADPDCAMKIWWPAERAVSPVRWELLGIDEDPEFIYYDRRRDLLVVYAQRICALPWRVVAELPRGAH